MKKTFFTFCVLMIFLPMFSVHAITVESIEVDWNTPREFTVKGYADSKNKNENIAIEILNPGKTMEDFSTSKQGQSYFIKMAQVKTTDNGYFEYTFRIQNATTKSGLFTIRIKNASENNGVYETSFGYSAKSVIDSTISNITPYMNKTEKDTTAITALLPLVRKGAEQVFFAKLPLFQDTIKVSKDSNDDGYSDLEDQLCESVSYASAVSGGEAMAKVIKASVAVVAYENSKLNFSDMISGYADALSISETPEYATYSNFNIANKNKVATNFDLVKNGKNIHTNMYENFFRQAVVITEFQGANAAGDVEDIIAKYASYFDLTKFNSSGANKRTEICKTILKMFELNSYNSLTAIQAQLNDETSEKNPIKNPTTPSNTSYEGIYTIETPFGNGDAANDGTNGEDIIQTTSSSSFFDIDGVQWAKKEIEYLAERGIISGKEIGVFAPYDNLTRAEACKLICSVFSCKEHTNSNMFADVNDADWFYDYVMSAHKAGLVQGTAETTFEPYTSISRQDFVVILNRALERFYVKNSNSAESIAFDDLTEISEYALDAINEFVKLGIISGYDDNTIRPKAQITRAEAAKVIYKVKNIYEGRE